MSRRKKSEMPDELELLQQEIRELKSINRTLTKQLRKLSKGANRIAALEELVKEGHHHEEESIEKDKKECPKCEEGILEILSLGKFVYENCSHCSYRKKA